MITPVQARTVQKAPTPLESPLEKKPILQAASSAVPPGRLENPGRQRGTPMAPLAFGPSATVSVLTRAYDANGMLIPPMPTNNGKSPIMATFTP